MGFNDDVLREKVLTDKMLTLEKCLLIGGANESRKL